MQWGEGDIERMIRSKEINDKQELKTRRSYVHECYKNVIQIEESPLCKGFYFCCGVAR